MLYFHYRDSKGLLSRRQLRNPSDDGFYLRGYDLESKGVKTFRKDRIICFFDQACDEYLTVESVADHKPIYRAHAAHADYTFEICFTGFSDKEKKSLTQQATQANMKVVQSVTVRLNFLCIGPNAGYKKMLKAEEQGVILITTDEFFALVNDGVMPESYVPKDAHMVEEGHGGAKPVIDPAVFFADWIYPPKAVLWSAFGIIKTERKSRNGQYVYTYEPENALIQEGDVFYFDANQDAGLQVIYVGDGLEIMHFSRKAKWRALGYGITHAQLVDWLKLGQVPPDYCQIHRHQSKSQIAQFYEYSE